MDVQLNVIFPAMVLLPALMLVPRTPSTFWCNDAALFQALSVHMKGLFWEECRTKSVTPVSVSHTHKEMDVGLSDDRGVWYPPQKVGLVSGVTETQGLHLSPLPHSQATRVQNETL